MNIKSGCGRADLVRAAAAGDRALVVAVATLLKLEDSSKTPPSELDTPAQSVRLSNEFIAYHGDEDDLKTKKSVLASIPFCRSETCTAIATTASEEAIATSGLKKTVGDTAKPVIYPYLSSWQRIQPRLRSAIAARRSGGSHDWIKIIRWLGQGRPLNRFPRRDRRGWGSRIWIVEDRSTRLTPYWRDQAIVRCCLSACFPQYAVKHVVIRDTQDIYRKLNGELGSHSTFSLQENDVVFVLSDLGALEQKGSASMQRWRRTGESLRDIGCRAIALIPTGDHGVLGSVPDSFTSLSWESQPYDRASSLSLRQQADNLVRWISPAVRVEPGLLRTVRLSLKYDAGAESLFWQHPIVVSPHSVAATLDPGVSKNLREQFAYAPPAVQELVLDAIRAWHIHLQPEVWLEEVISLEPDARDALPDPDEYEQACCFFRSFSARVLGGSSNLLSAAHRGWFSRTSHRLPDTAWNDPNVGPSLQRLEDRLHRDDPHYQPGHDFDPTAIASEQDSLQNIAVYQVGNHLIFHRGDTPETLPSGSPLADIDSRNALLSVVFDRPSEARSVDGRSVIQKSRVDLRDRARAELPMRAGAICLKIRSDLTEVSVQCGFRPEWASAIGRDRYGLWVDVDFGPIDGKEMIQRLRWITPGHVYVDRQRRISSNSGYWLADTLVTQSNWTSVTGANPSRFVDPTKPVEQVSWKDCQRYLQVINERKPGLHLSLPSEAQWLYAFRAERIESTESGGLKDRAEYEPGTVSRLGLYDMANGIREWCDDRPETRTVDLQTVQAEPDHRIVRDGWQRETREIADRNPTLGFRVARVRRVTDDTDV